jgi:hypothetical protein
MGDNGGDMEHNSSALSEQFMRWASSDVVPQIGGGGPPSQRMNERGSEANTDESKGTPVDLTPHGTGNTHEDGVTGPPGTLDECT